MVAFAQNKLSPAGAADVPNRRIRKIVLHDGVRGKIPNGTTDYIWQGWQTMEERNPFGGSGSTDTPIRQYVWGAYIDECIQVNLMAVVSPQDPPLGAYYLLQDLLYRAVALTNSGGQVVEAYDTDAYGNTLVFTGPGADGVWFTDDDVPSSYGANEIIYCGYRFDPDTQLYYVRNRTYNLVLGRWIRRDPIGYAGGINLYRYLGARAAVATDPLGNRWVKAPGIRLCEVYLPESLLYRLHFAHVWLSIGKVGWGFHPGLPATGNLGVFVPQPGLILKEVNYNNLPEKGGPGWQNGYKVCHSLYVSSCRCDPNKSAAGVKAALAAARKGPAPDYSVEFFDRLDWALSTIITGAMTGRKKENYWYGLPKPDVKLDGNVYPDWPPFIVA